MERLEAERSSAAVGDVEGRSSSSSVGATSSEELPEEDAAGGVQGTTSMVPFGSENVWTRGCVRELCVGCLVD